MRGSEELFFRRVKLLKGDAPPIFRVSGITFIHVKKNNLYFVLTTAGKNVSPVTYIEFLGSITLLFKDFLGVLNESNIRRHFLLLYELLDEVCDKGHLQSTSTEVTKSYVFNTSSENESDAILMASKLFNSLPVSVSQHILNSSMKLPNDKSTSVAAIDAANKPIQLKESNVTNELFVDVIERIDVVFGSDSEIEHSEVIGSIVMKSFLKGKPEIRLGLNDDLHVGKQKEELPFRAVVLDTCNFAKFVNTTEFNSQHILSLIPPTGEFTVMNYRCNRKLEVPFKIFHKLTRCSLFKIEAVIRIRSEFPKTSHAANFSLRIPMPPHTSTLSVELATGSTATYEHLQSEHIFLWEAKKFWGQSEDAIKLTILLTTPLLPEKRIRMGAINAQFEIPTHNMSGVQIRFLKIEDRNKDNNPNRWVRYKVRSNNYLTKMY